MPDLKTLYIFLLGVFLTLLFYVEEIIEEQEYKEKEILMIAFLAFIKAIIGGVMIVLIFYALQEVKLSFTIFTADVKFGEMANLFIAGVLSLFGTDLVKILKKKADNIAGGKK